MTDQIKELIKNDPFLALSICACNAYDFWLCYNEFVNEHVKLKFADEFMDMVFNKGKFDVNLSNVKTQSGKFICEIDSFEFQLIVVINDLEKVYNFDENWSIEAIEKRVNKIIREWVFKIFCKIFKATPYITTRPKKNQLSLFD